MRKHILKAILFLLLLGYSPIPQGMASHADNDPIKMGPNPCEDYLDIEIEDNQHKVSFIVMTDLLGKQVLKMDVNENETTKKIRLNVSNLKPGVYFVSLYSSSGVIEIRKIFKK